MLNGATHLARPSLKAELEAWPGWKGRGKLATADKENRRIVAVSAGQLALCHFPVLCRGLYPIPVGFNVVKNDKPDWTVSGGETTEMRDCFLINPLL